MNRVCIYCGRISYNENIWCEESYCSTENLPKILSHGEEIADITIKKNISVTRTSTIYEATRSREEILIKIAHVGMESKLINEAYLLQELQNEETLHPALPTLLPAYRNETINSYPFAETVFKGETQSFYVLDHLNGDLLSGLLHKNSQPWKGNVGYIGLTLADLLIILHKKGYVHLTLDPQHVLVRMDAEDIPRPVLLDFGIAKKLTNAGRFWNFRFSHPAYSPPELDPSKSSRSPVIHESSDVYGLGLIMYEMLAGYPAIPHHLASDQEIYTLKRNPNRQVNKLKRPDLEEDLSKVIMQAINNEPRNRQQTVYDFAQELLRFFQPAEKEKPKSFRERFDWQLIQIWVAAGVILALVSITLIVFLIPNN